MIFEQVYPPTTFLPMNWKILPLRTKEWFELALAGDRTLTAVSQCSRGLRELVNDFLSNFIRFLVKDSMPGDWNDIKFRWADPQSAVQEAKIYVDVYMIHRRQQKWMGGINWHFRARSYMPDFVFDLYKKIEWIPESFSREAKKTALTEKEKKDFEFGTELFTSTGDQFYKAVLRVFAMEKNLPLLNRLDQSARIAIYMYEKAHGATHLELIKWKKFAKLLEEAS